MSVGADIESLKERANAGDAGAQYALAARLSAAGDRDAATRWLEAAARGGSADALFTLATRKVNSLESAAEAAAGLDKAARMGSPTAARLLCVLEAIGVGVAQNEEAALQRMRALAQEGDPAAARELAGLLAIANVDHPLISALVERAGAADPVNAAFALARAAAGRPAGGPLFLRQCAAVLERARYPRAKQLAAPASAGGVAPPLEWGAVDSALTLAPRFAPKAERLSSAPDATLRRAAVSPEICEYVIAFSGMRLGPSLVYDPTSDRMVRDPLRTSSTACLAPLDLDLVIVVVNRIMRIAAEAPEENGEFLSVLRYLPGQQYRPHFDCIPPGPDLELSGQRAATALLFLNDDFEGGETHFTAADLKVRGARGDILVFRNVLPDGALDPLSRHAGLPVASGEKWLASKWFRTKKYRF